MSVRDYPSQEGYGRIGYVVLNHPDDPKQYIIVRDCPHCGKEARTVVPGQGLWQWEHGKFAQNAFPELSPDEREQVVSGTHPKCWDEMWAEVET